jgi:hypothetical protein
VTFEKFCQEHDAPLLLHPAFVRDYQDRVHYGDPSKIIRHELVDTSLPPPPPLPPPPSTPPSLPPSTRHSAPHAPASILFPASPAPPPPSSLALSPSASSASYDASSPSSSAAAAASSSTSSCCCAPEPLGAQLLPRAGVRDSEVQDSEVQDSEVRGTAFWELVVARAPPEEAHHVRALAALALRQVCVCVCARASCVFKYL